MIHYTNHFKEYFLIFVRLFASFGGVCVIRGYFAIVHAKPNLVLFKVLQLRDYRLQVVNSNRLII